MWAVDAELTAGGAGRKLAAESLANILAVHLIRHVGPPGYEVNLLYIAGLLALILGGAGPISIDRLLARRKREPAASPS
jgi:uncharacterized membrane protein YphA (DoxX/SURF4 family)